MSIVVSSVSALSVAANAKSAQQVSGVYEFVGPGRFTLVSKASATGLNAQCTIGGVPVIDDSVIPYTGAAGTLDTQANVIASQVLEGGRCSLFFRNTTAAAITVDAVLYWDPA